MPTSEAAYREFALQDPDGSWELYCGELRQKPAMSVEHNYIVFELTAVLMQQLDRREFQVRADAGRVRRSAENYFIPDVFVVPTALVSPLRHQPRALEAWETPLPLVVEVWSPSTGDYELDTKLPEYKRRGDLEIWRIQPFEPSLTVWRRQADGGYAEMRYTGGVVELAALPARIDLDALFA